MTINCEKQKKKNQREMVYGLDMKNTLIHVNICITYLDGAGRAII